MPSRFRDQRHSNVPVFPPPPNHPPAKIRFRADGSLVPDPNPIKLASPMDFNPPNDQKGKDPVKKADTELDQKLTALLQRCFSAMNDEAILDRVMGKLALETQLDILGDTDASDFLNDKEISKETKLWLLDLYGVFDTKMRIVLKQAATYA